MLASVLDGLLTLPGALLMTIGAGVMASGSGTSTVDPTTGEILTTGGDQGMITTGLVLVGVGWLLALVIQIYNRWVRGGGEGGAGSGGMTSAVMRGSQSLAGRR